MRDWTYGSTNWHSMAVKTDGKAYDVPADLYYSFPFVTEAMESEIVYGISLDDEDS